MLRCLISVVFGSVCTLRYTTVPTLFLSCLGRVAQVDDGKYHLGVLKTLPAPGFAYRVVALTLTPCAPLV